MIKNNYSPLNGSSILFPLQDGMAFVMQMYKGMMKYTLPQMLKEGYEPLSVARAMDLRNDICDFVPKDELSNVNASMSKHFGTNMAKLLYTLFHSDIPTADSVLFHPDGRVKFSWESDNFKNMKEDAQFYFGMLNLEKNSNLKRFDDFPERKNGLQLCFSREDVKKYTGISSRFVPDFAENPLLLALARGDEERCSRYVRNIFSVNKNPDVLQFVFPEKNPKYECENSIVLARCLNSVPSKTDVNSNFLFDSCSMDSEDAYLIGIPKKLKRVERILENM
jgi:hypothetical protein